jgi:hypothetical protein
MLKSQLQVLKNVQHQRGQGAYCGSQFTIRVESR